MTADERAVGGVGGRGFCIVGIGAVNSGRAVVTSLAQTGDVSGCLLITVVASVTVFTLLNLQLKNIHDQEWRN